MAHATLLAVTTGGIDTVQRTATTQTPTRRPRWLRWLDDPRLLEHLPVLLAVGVFAACYLRYRQRWFIPGYATYLLDVHQTVVDGTAIAPNQYRPLMPNLAAVVADGVGLTVPQAILAIDLVLLVVTVLALRSMLSRLNAPPAVLLAGAAGFAFWFTKLDHWSPETMLLIALAALVARELAADEPRWGDIAACGLLMLGARTDYAATLGVTIVAVAATRRSWRTAALGAGLIVAAVAATKGWQVLYPQARYQVDVVQVPFNLSPGSWAFVATYYGTLLACPLLLALRDREWPPMWPILLWFLAELGAVFIVGRVEESRLFMPFAALLGIAAVLAYQRLQLTRRPLHLRESTSC